MAPSSDPALGTQVISRILQVSARTVAKLIDEGRLRGHCLPGSQTRRVLRSELVDFCLREKLPECMAEAALRAQREYPRPPRKPRSAASAGGPAIL
jgi:excisionase family DNA binding protein